MTDELSCAVVAGPPIVVIRAVGRLTLQTGPQLRTAVLKSLAEQPDAVVVDAAGLTVADDIHLTVLAAAARHAAAWPAIPLLVCRPQREVAAGLTRLGIDWLVTVCADRGEAGRIATARALPPRLHEHLAPTPAATVATRQLVTEACRRWSIDHLTDVASLVATELVANAVRHAGTPIDFSVVRNPRYLHLSARDYAHSPARLTGADDPAQPGGRGLLLVDNLTAGWGCTPTPDGKVTWATFRLR